MRNVINYYYNLYPSSIYHVQGGYYFFINNVRYYFVKFTNDFSDIKKTYDFHFDLLNHNIYVHPIILNNKNQVLTLVNGQYYILLMTIYYDKKIEIKDVLSFSNISFGGNDFKDWGKIWAVKNDYLEYQLNVIGKSYPFLSDSFSYFLGMGELAIQLFNSIEKSSVPLVLCHKRIKFYDSFYEFYDSFNILFDYKVRDGAEYLKNKFFSGFDIEDDLAYFFSNIKLSNYEYLLFLIRMIYPTYYFDMFDEVISNNLPEECINKIVSKIDKYESIIKKIYQYLKSFLFVPTIEWFE